MTSISLMRLRTMFLAISAGALATSATVAAKNWSSWSPPAGIGINTAVLDGCPSLSPDGLELYFTSSRSGGFGGVDIWVAHRSNTEEAFGNPQNLGERINSGFAEFCPTMMPGKRLYFSSTRTGQGDIFVSRLTKDGWSAPTNLGSNINSADAVDESPSFYEDSDGREVMVFSSRRNGGRGQIFESVEGAPAQLAGGVVNTLTEADQRPNVRKDGLEIFWDSTRFGTLGNSDLWTATRSSTSEPWGDAVHLQSLSSAGPPGVGFTPGYDARPFLSRDGSVLLWASVRPGGQGSVDIYSATRSKLTGN